jgi:glycosyltransferase involved in cell wall biosynthesis
MANIRVLFTVMDSKGTEMKNILNTKILLEWKGLQMGLINNFRLSKKYFQFPRVQKVGSIRSECQVSDKSYVDRIEAELLQLSFVIVSHVAATGHPQELEVFLKKRSDKLLFIGHPFFYAKQKEPSAILYEKGLQKGKIKISLTSGPEVFLYLRDFLATFYFLFKFKLRFQIYVGVDPLNAFAGLLLKRLGYVKIVVFYVIDYVPTRFPNSILNSVYHSIDKLCVKKADYTWNLATAMSDARERRGIRKNETNQMTVPTGTHFEKNSYLPVEQIRRTDLAFLSHLRKGQGIELILEAMPTIIKAIPSVRLLVIGTGPLEEFFKEEVKKQKIANNVVFLGFIEDHDKIEKIISKCGVGLAPYVPDPKSFTWYADPGKPKVYLGCGIPVVITRVPEVAGEIEKAGAGIAIKYFKDELAAAVVKLLTDDDLYRQYRLKAIEFASKHTWDEVFRKALNEVVATSKKEFSFKD